MPEIILPPFPDEMCYSPEFRLLAACSWRAPERYADRQAVLIAGLCGEAIDWSRFARLVDQHGIQCLAYENLRRHGGEGGPDHLLASLKEQKVRIAVASLRQAAETLDLARKFSGQGGELLPLKGAQLSSQLYGEPGMRNSCDIDVLVRRDQVDRACELLEAEGYRCSLLGGALTPRQRDYLKTHFHHLEYSHPERGLFLELHWRFGSLWTPEQMDEVWRRAVTIDWMGHRTGTPDNDSLLLFLCDHGARHGFYSLKWVGDIARMVACRDEESWQGLLERAEELDLLRTLAHAGLLVHWLCGVDLPAGLRMRIVNDRAAVAITEAVCRQYLSCDAGGISSGKPAGSMKLAWLKLRLRPSIPLWRSLKPKMVAVFDFMDFPLPDRLFWLYYPLRPVTIIWRHFFRSGGGKRP